MAVNRNFVVKNGLEVNTNLILADVTSNSVGIGTSITNYKLHVNGGIGATDIYVSGFGTVSNISGETIDYTTATFNVGSATSLTGSTLNFSGIATVGSLSIGANEVVSSARQLKNIASLDSTTTATIEAAIANAPNTFTNLVVTGVSTLGVTGIGTLNVTGETTLGTLNVTGISTLGSVQINSGIVTASSGIVTYYGDGTNLSLAGNPDLLSSTGIGIGTTGGLVGYGITFVNFYGAGVSTSLYDSSVGIATIFFEGGGGGGGAIGIGSTFPGTLLSLDPAPSNGDLFFHIDYGRTFLYYDEVTLGVGSSAFWIDSSPFNSGINAVLAGVAFSTGSSSSPSAYFEGYPTTGWFSPAPGQFGVVSLGSTILAVNPSGVNVTGVTTSTSVVVGSATTFTENLVVSGDARVTGILTVGTSSITLDGTNNSVTLGTGNIIDGSIANQIKVGSGLTINSSGVVAGILTATSFFGNGAGLSGVDPFTAGTIMLFQQTSAPTGWTKITTHNDKTLRVVSGSAGSGGSTAFTSVFASRSVTGTVGNTTLTTSQIPSHDHTVAYKQSVYSGGGHAGTATWNNEVSTTTGSTGGGGSHNHSFSGTALDFDVQYVDVIFASKD